MIQTPFTHRALKAEDLTPNLDYRDAATRYEVFMKFYEYHLEHRGHPGCVYFIYPWLWERYNFDMEQKLWFCYLNGVTQNPMTTWRIFTKFPSLKDVNIEALDKWHLSTHADGRPMWRTLSYDIDRRYQKGHLVKMVANYKELVGDRTQEEYFNSFAHTPQGVLPPTGHFDALWKEIRGNFHMFGRLSTFSYMEYLKIAGIGIECSTLLFGDMSGSLSHRNGVMKVLGLDEWEQHKKINPNVKHNKDVVALAESTAYSILIDAQARFKDRNFAHDVNYFTLESTLCCYKSWFRKNRRYANVYIDMMHDRIIDGNERWGVEDKDADMFMQCREDSLPDYARAGGITKEKQNHFRLTGEPIFLGNMFPDNFKKGLENEICEHTRNIRLR